MTIAAGYVAVVGFLLVFFTGLESTTALVGLTRQASTPDVDVLQ